MPDPNDLITELPPGFVSEFADEILGTIPEEKVQCELRQVRAARIMQQAGSVSIPGIGQKIASIDPRLYFRLYQQYKDQPNWLNDFLADNPQMCAPGYKPKASALRHGKTFVAGKPV